MRNVKAATGQKMWPAHQRVESLSEEYTPFEAQMGAGTDWLG